MVGTAYGACITATPAELLAAGVTGGTAGTGSGTDIIADAGTATCLDGYFGTATAACSTEASTAGTVATWSGCTACTKAANVATLTCTDATAANTVVLTCDAGFAFTATVNEIPAVTTTSGANGATGVVTALPYIAADAAACPAVVGQTLRAAVPLSDLVAAVPASCAATACSGEQAGCVTGTATNTVDTCSAAGSLKCTQSKRGFSLANGEATACAKVNVATYKEPASDASGTCEAASCNAGWTISGTAPNQVCTTANVCTAGAVKAGYAAAGIVARAAADAITRACPSSCDATPPTGTCTAGVAAVSIRAVAAASAATTVEGLGAVTCAEGFTGTAVGACPVADAAFTYTGCTAAAAPASVAQTIVAFVLTVVAMYL